jgi:hypothetical protein
MFQSKRVSYTCTSKRLTLRYLSASPIIVACYEAYLNCTMTSVFADRRGDDAQEAFW